MVIVSRNLERPNENDGFEMTALELLRMEGVAIARSLVHPFIPIGRRHFREAIGIVSSFLGYDRPFSGM